MINVLSDEYLKRSSHFYSGYIPELIKDLIEENTGNFKVIADLGAGDGSTLYALNRNNLLTCFDKIFAVDLSDIRLTRVGAINSKIIPVLADLYNISSVDDSSVDFIILKYVIEHIEDEDRLLEEVKRILNKDGLLYLSTAFKKWYSWYYYKNKYGETVLDPTHIREYKSDVELISKLEKHGFRVIINRKNLFWFPLLDFFINRLGLADPEIYIKNFLLRNLRNIKVPVAGYYEWELVCRK